MSKSALHSIFSKSKNARYAAGGHAISPDRGRVADVAAELPLGRPRAPQQQPERGRSARNHGARGIRRLLRRPPSKDLTTLCVEFEIWGLGEAITLEGSFSDVLKPICAVIVNLQFRALSSPNFNSCAFFVPLQNQMLAKLF